MKTLDHKIIADIIKKNFLKKESKRYKTFFALGCLYPDYNIFTYFNGFWHTHKVLGHNYENSKFIISKLQKSLKFKKVWNSTDYFKFGCLLHYIIDSFTFPHNIKYTKSIKEHIAYENNLHKRLIKKIAIKKHLKKYLPENNIIDLHLNYSNKNSNLTKDLLYIFSAINLCMKIYTEKKYI